MVNLYIVRHGETIQNIQGICQGQSEGKLSEKGIRENQKLALELENVKFDSVYASPLDRARMTCETILEKHPNLDIQFDNRLMEWYMGTLEGKVYPESINILNNEYEMESEDAVRCRCEEFLNDLFSLNKESNVLIVSHGLTIKMIESIISKQSFEDMDLLSNSKIKIIKFSKKLVE